MHMVSILLSKMDRPNVPMTSTKTALIHSNLCGDHDTMHASSAYSTPQIARRAHSGVVSSVRQKKQRFDGGSFSDVDTKSTAQSKT